MSNLFSVSILALGLFLLSCSKNDTNTTDNTPKANQQKVVELLKSIETGATEPISYINPDKYIQHNLGVADGIAGFGELLSHLPPNSAKVNTVRAFTDGDYVFTHSDYNFFGPKIGFDVFRFEDGKIVEHWDNLIETPATPNPSGRTMIDGSVTLTDLTKTTDNKQVVVNFVNDLLLGKNPSNAPSYFVGDQYVQHNPQVADGLSGLNAFLAKMKADGVELAYTKIHKILGQGNFVLAIGEGTLGGKDISLYDLYRLENGKIVEHWDVIEHIADPSTWKNTNGKFNFK